MKKFDPTEFFWLIIIFAMGVGSIITPFYIVLTEREDPIDTVSEVIGVAVGFVFFISIGVGGLWVGACFVAEGLLKSIWWGHLKEGMRKEDVLHILGEPTWKSDDQDEPRERESWRYEYRWFARQGWVEFGEDDTVTRITLPKEKRKPHYNWRTGDYEYD